MKEIDTLIKVLLYIAMALIGGAVGYYIRKSTAEKLVGSAELEAQNVLINAERESDSLKKEALLEAKEEIYKMRTQAEAESDKRRKEINKFEKRLINKEDHLDKRSDELDRKDQSLNDQLKTVQSKDEQITELLETRIKELEKISGMTPDEAKELLLKDLEDEIIHESAIIIKEQEAKVKEESNKIARNIIADAIEKVAPEFVADATITTVQLPNEDMKGRIIGREGRNIRAIENMTGVDLIIDDTPEAVTLSSFDPVRREIARIALERLIVDGRIHPTRIEEVVKRSEVDVEDSIRDAGDDAVFELGIHDMARELKDTLGRLKYRTSYGQNALQHSIEVAQISAIIADMLGADVKLAKRAGLLHDIGKAIDHEYEETHVALGVDLAKRYKEHDVVIDAIASHHDDQEPQFIESIIVKAADALSAARPGARMETLQSYIKRLENLEAIANSFEGIERAYAVQAGREIRIIAEPTQVSESETTVLSREIANKIQNEMDYPGQIKVNVIRETRSIEYAK